MTWAIAVHMTNMSTFNEAAHDRDSGGRFTEMAGSEQSDSLTAATATAVLSPPSGDQVRAAQAQVELRAGDREISDSTAQTIAADALAHLPKALGSPDDFPLLRDVALAPASWNEDTDFDRVEALHAELSTIYQSPSLSLARRQRVNALFTFSLHGGDNE